MKSYTLNLPYYKQGDDLSWAQGETESDRDAFELHAGMLEHAASMLRKCVALAEEDKVRIGYADTHGIGIECSYEVGDKLVEQELLSVDEWEDEEEWDEEELPEYDPEDDPDFM